MPKSSRDISDLKQKVSNLRKQCNENDILLDNLSIPLSEVQPNMQRDLAEHAKFKRTIGLYAMDMSYLSEFYCTNTEANINKKIAILKAIGCNEQIEKDLVKTNGALTEVTKFKHNMSNDFKRNGDMDRLLRDTNRDIDALTEKKNKLEESIKIDLDGILLKLDQATQ